MGLKRTAGLTSNCQNIERRRSSQYWCDPPEVSMSLFYCIYLIIHSPTSQLHPALFSSMLILYIYRIKYVSFFLIWGFSVHCNIRIDKIPSDYEINTLLCITVCLTAQDTLTRLILLKKESIKHSPSVYIQHLVLIISFPQRSKKQCFALAMQVHSILLR